MSRRIVLDTSVLIAGLRSRNGASFQILSRLGGTEITVSVSVPLVLGYEAAAKASARASGLSIPEIDDVIDFLCSVAEHREIFYLWRPMLRDPGDEMVLEVAVEAGSEMIVTHNVRDFAGADRFGIQVVTPAQFLMLLEVEK